ncbi:probable WRKY transcription factor 26 [Zingiber officinale]|uniref:WRKY domain-containing protein n=1 Tax=Zingiber officinale TaxID=94328 RepID=A0A8J5GU47_ZINOF|nr:probable WRKY transcription factor 26 [Zingiber officinale]KAG6509961.1 hypothetical protein ZIOFF_027969 [Zingiber officinale]
MQDASSFQILKPVASRPSSSFRFFPDLPATSSGSLPPNDHSAAKAAVALILDDDVSETKETRTNAPASLLLSNLQGKQNNHASVQHELNQLELARNQQQITKQDRPSSCDGYNWRKYGQKQVKGSEYPRSYYKCSHLTCPVKKIVERSLDGQIAEIVYKGEHDHPKPRPPKRRLSSGSQEHAFVAADENGRSETGNLQSWSSTTGSLLLEVNPKELSSSCRIPTSSVQAHLADDRPIDTDHQVANSTVRVCRVPSRMVTRDRKRRKNDDQNSVGEDSTDAHSVIQTSGDGYHWRKYGQKNMKGNSYPRNYYKCMSPNCNVRKYTEKAFDDSNFIVTTYEGEHDHEMPVKKISSATSNPKMLPS